MADHADNERDGGSVRELNSKGSFHNTGHGSDHAPKRKKERKIKGK